IEVLRLDLDDYGKGRVLEPLTGFAIGIMDGPEVTTDYHRPISYGILRREFDYYLLQRCGARLRLGEGVKSLERSDGGWLVNGSIQARMLVGAGGHFCPVARFLRQRSNGHVRENVIAAQELEIELTPQQLERCPVRAGLPYLTACADLKGYGWY